ncbi:hypothetical protein BU24DRAFT_433696 [Aaosphaeria arxii CBS 175.79]|uniref:Zn(2)-C6 fungal-type domain-containing protein n=1 Tax=Aaosphaeria arxii CBS 175.79 TaxID=1450172 RepID=A0A6A5XLV3_9PLEO|nr:uncharacterized protein BU24DRAFT_433696 [Aaosphaeria arxii CBS 175.79]KAF2014215.1 hypothetical protein BU24DRAFT_433696 [Aaosphaeria arxii CBS 175.79]
MSEKVAKRKAHTKSRRGCFQCKQRHTKCNELHPQCGNCVRLNIQCTWPTVTSTPPSAHPENHVSMVMEHRNFSSPDLHPNGATSTLPLDDMRLLHHWSRRTSLFHRPGASNHEQIWREDVIDIAFDHPFLLHGVLALAAIHKCSTEYTTQSQREKLLQQADSHMTRSLGPYRGHLENPSEVTAVPMFVLSSILVTYNLGTAQLGAPEKPIDALVHCFRLIQGVKVVIFPHWEKVKASRIFSHVASGAMESNPPEATSEEMEKYIPGLYLLTARLELEGAEKESCDEAIEQLYMIWHKNRWSTDYETGRSILMTWPAIIATEFLNLLNNASPAAVIILTHFAVLMASSEASWWLHGWPKRILRAAEDLFVSRPDLQPWLVWPREHIMATESGVAAATTPSTATSPRADIMMAGS